MEVTGPTCDWLHLGLFHLPFSWLWPLYHLLGPEGGAVCLGVVSGLEDCPAHWSTTELGAGLPWTAERGPRQRKDCLGWEVAGQALDTDSSVPAPSGSFTWPEALAWNMTF